MVIALMLHIFALTSPMRSQQSVDRWMIVVAKGISAGSHTDKMARSHTRSEAL
jgi:hypothetical protein